MAKKPTRAKSKAGRKRPRASSRRKGRSTKKASKRLSLYAHQNDLKKDVAFLTQTCRHLQDRLEDSEIHVNLLTRLITTLCVEKMGMRVGVLKRLLKRIEKEAIRDSQIVHLESLYNLPHESSKKSHLAPQPPKSDPWDDIS